MKDKFKSYYKPTNEEFDEMWNNGIIAFDANVLLNFYRYSENTNKLFFEIFKKASEKIWVPNQSVYEFLNNRLSVIHNELNNYNKIQNALNDFCSNIENEFVAHRKHPFIDDYKDLLNELNAAVDKIEKKLIESKEAYNKLYVQEDNIMLILSTYFDGKVGDPYSKDKLNEIYKVAKERFENDIPPGYINNKKKKNVYGDYIIWCQLIDNATKNKKHIIFITDERKNDWWYEYDNIRFGPRPELRAEMYELTGVNFYMYSPEKFLEHSKKYFKVKVNEESITEVAETSRINEEMYKIKRRGNALKALSKLATRNMLRNTQELLSKSIPSEEELERMQDALSKSILSKEELERMQDALSKSIPSEEELERMQNIIQYFLSLESN